MNSVDIVRHVLKECRHFFILCSKNDKISTFYRRTDTCRNSLSVDSRNTLNVFYFCIILCPTIVKENNQTPCPQMLSGTMIVFINYRTCIISLTIAMNLNPETFFQLFPVTPSDCTWSDSSDYIPSRVALSNSSRSFDVISPRSPTTLLAFLLSVRLPHYIDFRL